MENLKALLFDLDGTLVDTEHFHLDCWNEVLSSFNVKLNHNDWLLHYVGVPLPLNAKNIIDKYNLPIELSQLIEQREKLTLKRLQTQQIALMPHAIEALDFFSEMGLVLALVTSSPKQDVDAIFKRNSLGKYFALVITRSDVSKSKPDPESYNFCLARLGLDKKDCIVFEDTLNGIKSAKAAGLTCFAVQSNIAGHYKLAIADKVFLSFKQVISHFM